MAKYRQISLTIDDMEQNKLGFDLHQMWGLYADKGQGVCLVFDKDTLCNNLDKDVQHINVSYDKAVESFYIAKPNDFQSIQHDIQKQIKKIFFHKRNEWEHEQEYRLIKRCPNLEKEEYVDYGEALKYIILNSVIEDTDSVKFKKNVEKLNKHTQNGAGARILMPFSPFFTVRWNVSFHLLKPATSCPPCMAISKVLLKL